MAYNDTDRKTVKKAIDVFNRVGREVLLKQYGGQPSTCWYVNFQGKLYDQKLILRVAHDLQGLGALPAGKGTFKAKQARQHLCDLGFCVQRIDKN